MRSIGSFSVSNLPSVYFDGYYRVLGYLPSPEDKLAAFPKFGANFLSGESEWKEIDLTHLNGSVKDQGSSSACVGFSCSSGMDTIWRQMGKPPTAFDSYFLYGLINNGRDAGAYISDALSALMTTGVCRDEDLPPGLMFKSQFPQSAFESAKRFKLLRAFHCRSFEEICAAISRGFATPFGIMVGRNFAQLDTEGVAPLPNGGGGGHAILGVGLKKSSRYGWLIKFQNSWSPRYGLNGYAYLHKKHFQYMAPDAFAIQSMNDPDSSVPVVP